MPAVLDAKCETFRITNLLTPHLFGWQTNKQTNNTIKAIINIKNNIEADMLEAGKMGMHKDLSDFDEAKIMMGQSLQNGD